MFNPNLCLYIMSTLRQIFEKYFQESAGKLFQVKQKKKIKSAGNKLTGQIQMQELKISLPNLSYIT